MMKDYKPFYNDEIGEMDYYMCPECNCPLDNKFWADIVECINPECRFEIDTSKT